MTLSADSAPALKRPPWRALALTTVLVLAAHAWLLNSAPVQFSPLADSLMPAAMVTRSIAPAPPVVAAAPTPEPRAEPAPKPVVKPVPKPAPKPVFKPNKPAAQSIRAEAAPNLIANSLSESPVTSHPSQEAAARNADAAALGAQAAMAAAAAASAASAASESVAASLPATSAPAAPAAEPSLPQTTVVTAMALPASAQLKYRMTGQSKGLTYHAGAELAWRTSDGRYDARMTVSAFLLGSRSLASIGKVSAEGLAPTRFADRSRSEVAAHFEPDKGRITFSANTPSVPWIKGAQDRVTVFLQLGGMVAGNPAAFPPGASISLYTVGPRSADVWTFLVGSEEAISLPAGDMAALKLTRKPRGEYDQMVEIWLAPSLGYLPVRSKITQANGDFVDQQLIEANSL